MKRRKRSSSGHSKNKKGGKGMYKNQYWACGIGVQHKHRSEDAAAACCEKAAKQ